MDIFHGQFHGDSYRDLTNNGDIHGNYSNNLLQFATENGPSILDFPFSKMVMFHSNATGDDDQRPQKEMAVV